MASKWKYAALDAQSRLQMLRDGNKDVFEEEIARTKSVVDARRKLSLDTSEQEKWLDTVGYNYNLSAAKDMGIGSDKVAKSGYAKLYLGSSGNGKASSGGGSGLSKVALYKTTTGLTSTPISDAKYKIQEAGKLAKSAIEDKYAAMKENAREQVYAENEHLREALLNAGASDGGGKMARAYEQIESGLESLYADYDKAKEMELEASEKKYAGLVDTLLEYRRNGTAKDSLGAIANGLIYNAAKQDGYDASALSGIGSKAKKITKSDGNADTAAADEVSKQAAKEESGAKRFLPSAESLSGKSEIGDEAEGSDAGVEYSDVIRDAVKRLAELAGGKATSANGGNEKNDTVKSGIVENSESGSGSAIYDRIIGLLEKMGIGGDEALRLFRLITEYTGEK